MIAQAAWHHGDLRWEFAPGAVQNSEDATPRVAPMAVATVLWFGVGLLAETTIERPKAMLVELTIIPVGSGRHISDELAEVLKLIDAFGLPYELTPTGTCIEGDWDDVMKLVRRCHDEVRGRCSHVVTQIKIEDEAGATDKLTANVESLEKKVGRPLRRTHATRSAR